MDLYFKKIGSGPPLFILHGLYGSSDNWYSIAQVYATKHSVYLIDLRNHGRSPHHNEHSYEVMCADIRELAVKENIQKVALLGHSMGGKVAMLYAMLYPGFVSGLIVADIAPVNYSSVDNFNSQVIVHLNIMHTLLSVDLTLVNNRSEINDILAENIKNADVRQFLMKNIHRSHDGTFNWKFNLKALSNALPKIMGFVPSDKILADKTIDGFPVLFIRGGKSDYILPDYFKAIKGIFPQATVETIPNTGHWLHAEQPGKFNELVLDFLNSI